jgi:hypothetical protein
MVKISLYKKLNIFLNNCVDKRHFLSVDVRSVSYSHVFLVH